MGVLPKLTEIMNFRILTSILLTGTIGLSVIPPVLAETPPAQTYQPGFWQPVARFNPKENVSLKMVNESGIKLNYDITSLETDAPRDLENGQDIVLKDINISAYIMVYPAQNIDPDNPFALKFTVSVNEADNLVTVTVIKADKGFMGHRTINLQKTGAIYFY